MKKQIVHSAKSLLILVSWLLLASGSFAQSWAPKSNVPLTTGIDAAVTFTINNKVYFGGGAGSKYLFEFNPATNTWTQKADIPGVTGYRAFCVGFAIGSKGYIGLGNDGATYLKDLWEYDPATNAWTQKANFPGMARTTAGSFVVNGNAYVMGGIDSSNSYFINEVWEYNPTSNMWTSKANLPSGAGYAFPYTFTIGNKGYIMGGEKPGSEATACFAFDPTTNTWAPKANFTGAPRQAGIAYVINNIAYCGLGMSAYDTMFADMYKYDAAANTWTSIGNFSGGARAWPAASVANGKAYIGSGWDFNTFFKDWWEFTPSTTGLSELPEAQRLICYPNPSNGIVMVSNEIAAGSSVEVFSLTGQSVYREKLPADKKLDLKKLSAGQYIIEIKENERSWKQVITLQTM